ISQIALLVVLRLAKMAADRGGPGPMIFNNAYLIFMMAHGIVAVSIITALLPRMSAFAAEHRYRDVAAQLSLGTRLSAVILIPAVRPSLATWLLTRAFGFGRFASVVELVVGGWMLVIV